MTTCVVIATIATSVTDLSASLSFHRGLHGLEMQTIYIGREEISAYMKDYAKRLEALGDSFPKVWALLGDSGVALSRHLLLALEPQLQSQVDTLRLDYIRSTRQLHAEEGYVSGDISHDASVLLIDSAVHTGSSMRKAVDFLEREGISRITSFSLVVKIGASFVPNVFSVLINDCDRAIFDLQTIPNNRLSEKLLFGSMHLVEKGDLSRSTGSFPKPFTNGCLAEFYYHDVAYGTKTYLYEMNGQVAGFVSLLTREGAALVDAWGTCLEWQGQGIGGATIRWAETWARASGCNRVELWAYEPAVSVYLDMGFSKVTGQPVDFGDDHPFFLMRKELLYGVNRGA